MVQMEVAVQLLVPVELQILAEVAAVVMTA
jgi:hypothetical protein